MKISSFFLKQKHITDKENKYLIDNTLDPGPIAKAGARLRQGNQIREIKEVAY